MASLYCGREGNHKTLKETILDLRCVPSKWSVCNFLVKSAETLRDDTHTMSTEIFQFSRPLNSLVHLSPKFFHPLTLDVQFQTNIPSPNDNQSNKRKHNQRVTVICNQVLPSSRFLLQYQPINLVWLPFDFFHLAEASILYLLLRGSILLCVWAVVRKHQEMSLIYNFSLIRTHFAINMCYLHNLKT